jgi:hypothetical protein
MNPFDGTEVLSIDISVSIELLTKATALFTADLAIVGISIQKSRKIVSGLKIVGFCVF